MKQDFIIYHGSQQIVEIPQFGIGKEYNDYGQGFYCTENIELAKEWACPIKNNGYSNKYILHLDGLNVMHLTKGEFNILNWLAILLSNRKFDISSPIGSNAREFILSRFMPDTTDVDIMIGYRADDSYFSFAQDFVAGAISYRQLGEAMRLGKLGEQIVLVSEKAFDRIRYVSNSPAEASVYYKRKKERDKVARKAYRGTKSEELSPNELLIVDIIREEMKQDDVRLR